MGEPLSCEIIRYFLVMQKIIFLSISFFISTIGFNQSQEQMLRYNSFSSKANNFFTQNEFDSSLLYFTKAFNTIGGLGQQQDKYNAAICYYKLNIIDSTFRIFFRLAQKTDFLDFHELNSSSEFETLKSDSRWNKLKESLIPESTITYDSLAKILLKINRLDQGYRSKVLKTSNNFGWESNEFKAMNDSIKYFDSINLFITKNIIDKYGWLGNAKIGKRANKTIWLVIQHSNIECMKKYFPIMKEAVEKGDASRIHLAYLEDRILMFENKRQIYGTQFQIDKKTGVQTMYKLEDPEKLNERRKSIGLYELNLNEIIIQKD